MNLSAEVTSSAYKTAITRTKISAPTRFLKEEGLLKGDVLDYGCGKGFDADELGFDKYDPHFFPDTELSTYDVIVCNYVLNVVDEDTGKQIIETIRSLLKVGGKAYISVRRDFKVKEYVSKKGTYQRLVDLALPVLKQDSGFCIYVLEA